MIALVVSACFMGDPTECRSFRTPVPDQTDVYTCTTSAQLFLPAWAAEHAGWRITKWGCSTSEVADL
jgi:hypothetical protein